MIENGAVAIRADRIVAVGPRAEIDRRYQAAHRLDRPDALIAPGLVNTHTHVPMSLLRGIANDLRLQDWLTKFIFPAEARNVTADFVRWGTRLACLEMLLSGTTTYTDMYYFEDAVAEADREAGLRAVLGETIIGFPAPDAPTPEDALRFTERFIQRFRNDPADRARRRAPRALHATPTPRSRPRARSPTATACRSSSTWPKPAASATTRWRNGARRPWRSSTAWACSSGRTVAAHCVWVDDADMRILKARGTGVAHCPSSNMMLASGVAPVVKMLAAGLNVGLGTDGPAGSNNDFDLMEEMDLAAKLQKVTTGDPQALSAAQALEMATIGGARVARPRKGNRLARTRQARRPDHHAARRAQRRAALRRGLPDRLCAQRLPACATRWSTAACSCATGARSRSTRTSSSAKAAEYGVKISESLQEIQVARIAFAIALQQRT